MTTKLVLVGRGIAVGCVLLLLGLLVWKVVHRPPGASFVAKIEKGDKPPAPELGLPVLAAGTTHVPPSLAAAIQSGRVKITNLAGRPTVVNFFASYCVPCRQEGPLLAHEAKRLSGQVVFLGVAYQDFRSDAKRLLAKSGATYPVLFDGQGNTEATWGLTGIPETFVLTANGHVVKHLIGRLSEDDLRQAVSAALSPQ